MRKTSVITAVLLAALASVPRLGATPVAPKEGPIHVAFVLTEGATMIDFAGPWEVFQDAMIPGRGASHDERMAFRLYTVGASRQPIHTSGGLTVTPDHTFADAPTPDLVVVGAQKGDPALAAWLRKVHGEGRVVMSVCTGAFKLAEAGLLDGKRATTHHGYFEPFTKRFPNVTLVPSRRFVQSDENVFTAGGLTSGIDLALHMVDLYFGRAVAQQTATYMEYESTGWRD